MFLVPVTPENIKPALNGRSLPEGIDSIELNVTGPGMEQIEESIEIGEKKPINNLFTY